MLVLIAPTPVPTEVATPTATEARRRTTDVTATEVAARIQRSLRTGQPLLS